MLIEMFVTLGPLGAGCTIRNGFVYQANHKFVDGVAFIRRQFRHLGSDIVPLVLG